MPARGRRYRSRAFTLLEMLVALGLITAAMGVATTLLMSGRRRFRRATEAAYARACLSLAADRMVADIRGSSGAKEEGGALVVLKPDGKVTWFARGGALVRECGGDEHVYDLALAGMRVTSPRPAEAFVEVAFELASVAKRRVPGAPAPVLYVAASPRLKEAP